MQKYLAFILAVMLVLSLPGCTSPAAESEAAPPVTQIANPWTSWNSIEEAEQAVGFSFGLPDKINDRYTVDTVRTMNNELIEVTYYADEFKVWVRKQTGEGQDISGDYNQYEICTETSHNGGTIASYTNTANSAVKQIISHQGYSWSLVAPNGYGDNSNDAFLRLIWN